MQRLHVVYSGRMRGFNGVGSKGGPTTCGCGLNKDQVFHIINITVCAFSSCHLSASLQCD